MYCIFHLPRTGSRYLHTLINNSLIFLDPRHRGTEMEPFNPAFNTRQQIEEKYNKFTSSAPRTTVKLVINHYPDIAYKFLKNIDYKTIFIKPKFYKKRVLKALVEKHLNTHSNGTDRKNTREPFVGTLSFPDELIIERLEHYKIHMEYETKCDYVFYDEEMFDNPQHITDVLELPFVGCKYKRVAPHYTDEEMMLDVNLFYSQYEKLCH
jgi:hypothetical protein